MVLSQTVVLTLILTLYIRYHLTGYKTFSMLTSCTKVDHSAGSYVIEWLEMYVKQRQKAILGKLSIILTL